MALLGACVVEFARSGRGTLSPVDPPRHLVVRGLYRYVRNPMYLSVTAILLGEVLLTRSSALAIYWAVWFAVVNLFVIAYEEPWLRGRFGDSYAEYAAKRRPLAAEVAATGPVNAAFHIPFDGSPGWSRLHGA